MSDENREIHNRNVKRGKEERHAKLDKKRNKVISQLYTIAKSTKDFETILNDCITVMDLSSVRIDIEEIRKICTAYFQTVKTPEGLENSNKLFEQLDHSNNCIIEISDESLGLKYI